MPPEAFRAGLVVAVLLVDLQVCHLEEVSESHLYSRNLFLSTDGFTSLCRKCHNSLTLCRKHLPTNSGQSVYCSNSLRNVLETTKSCYWWKSWRWWRIREKIRIVEQSVDELWWLSSGGFRLSDGQKKWTGHQLHVLLYICNNYYYMTLYFNSFSCMWSAYMALHHVFSTSEANNMSQGIDIISDRQVALLHLLWKW